MNPSTALTTRPVWASPIGDLFRATGITSTACGWTANGRKPSSTGMRYATSAR